MGNMLCCLYDYRVVPEPLETMVPLEIGERKERMATKELPEKTVVMVLMANAELREIPEQR